MSFPGLRGSRIYRYKYAGCEYSKLRGITVRLLTATEITEFRTHIEKCMDKRSKRSRTQ
jgi:hypothetical protein